jgi:hypothetical protein
VRAISLRNQSLPMAVMADAKTRLRCQRRAMPDVVWQIKNGPSVIDFLLSSERRPIRSKRARSQGHHLQLTAMTSLSACIEHARYRVTKPAIPGPSSTSRKPPRSRSQKPGVITRVSSSGRLTLPDSRELHASFLGLVIAYTKLIWVGLGNATR